MTSNHREPRLPKRAEELLAGWPAPARGALEWEESASTVMARVRTTEIGSTPDDLLDAPLPEEADEAGRAPPSGVPSDAPPAGELSLAEIARAALAGKEATTREVAREGLLAAELGRKNPPREPAPPPRALHDAASLQGRVVHVPEPAPEPPRRPPPPPPPRVLAEVEASPVSEAIAHSEVPAPPSRERRKGGSALILGGGLLALAASFVLYLVSAERKAPDARLTATSEASATSAPLAATPKGATGETAMTPTAEEAKPTASALAIAELPMASPTSADGTSEPAPQRRAASSPAIAMQKEKTLAFHVKKESASNAGKLVLEEREDAPVANAAPAAPQQAPAPAALSERPSTGAVQAALGSVLTSARGCLAGQETGARATITFEGPTGRVKSVVLDGSTQGSPAESCVRAALSGARLPPFSEPTFSASVTVRPL